MKESIVLTKVAEHNTKRYEEDAADDHADSIDVTPVKDDQQQDDSNRLATTFAIRSGATTVNLICHLWNFLEHYLLLRWESDNSFYNFVQGFKLWNGLFNAPCDVIFFSDVENTNGLLSCTAGLI